MPLGKCLFKIYIKDIWIFTCFCLSDHNIELSKNLKNSNKKADDFIQLLTKCTSYIGLSKLVKMVVIFMVSTLKDYWFKYVLSKCEENLLQLIMTFSSLVDYVFCE